MSEDGSDTPATRASDARRALLAFLMGVALGALVGLLARRPREDEQWPGGSES